MEGPEENKKRKTEKMWGVFLESMRIAARSEDRFSFDQSSRVHRRRVSPQRREKKNASLQSKSKHREILLCSVAEDERSRN